MVLGHPQGPQESGQGPGHQQDWLELKRGPGQHQERLEWGVGLQGEWQPEFLLALPVSAPVAARLQRWDPGRSPVRGCPGTARCRSPAPACQMPNCELPALMSDSCQATSVVQLSCQRFSMFKSKSLVLIQKSSLVCTVALSSWRCTASPILADALDKISEKKVRPMLGASQKMNRVVTTQYKMRHTAHNST